MAEVVLDPPVDDSQVASSGELPGGEKLAEITAA